MYTDEALVFEHFLDRIFVVFMARNLDLPLKNVAIVIKAMRQAYRGNKALPRQTIPRFISSDIVHRISS
jgi:hypothetical protein